MHPNDGRVFFHVTDPDVSYEKACAACLVRELGTERVDAAGAGGLPFCQMCEEGLVTILWPVHDRIADAELTIAVCGDCRDTIDSVEAFLRVMADAGVVEYERRYS